MTFSEIVKKLECINDVGEKQGWRLSVVNENPLQLDIQKDDEEGIFENDCDAVDYVFRNRHQCKVCREALLLAAQH